MNAIEIRNLKKNFGKTFALKGINLDVAQDLTDPRQINVSFSIRPVVGVKWILVSFGVEL